MKLLIGLYLDLLIKTVKAQGEIGAITSWESSDKTQGKTRGERRRKKDRKHDSWKRYVFSHQLWAMASYVRV